MTHAQVLAVSVVLKILMWVHMMFSEEEKKKYVNIDDQYQGCQVRNSSVVMSYI